MSTPRVSTANRDLVYAFGKTVQGTRVRLPGDRCPRPAPDLSRGAAQVLNHATAERANWSREDVKAFLAWLPTTEKPCVVTGAKINSWLERRFPVGSH